MKRNKYFFYIFKRSMIYSIQRFPIPGNTLCSEREWSFSMKAIAIGFPPKGRVGWQIIWDIEIYFQNHPKRVLENSRKISIFIPSYERPPEIRLLTEISRLLNAALFSKEVNLNCHCVCPILSQPPIGRPI